MLPQTAGYRPLVPHGPFYPAFTSTIPEGRTFNMTEYNKFRRAHPFHDKKNENSPNLGTDPHICCQISLNNGWISPSLLNSVSETNLLGQKLSMDWLMRICLGTILFFSLKIVVFCSGFRRYIYIYGGCPKYLFPDSPQSLSQSRSNRGTTVSNRGRVCSSLIRSYT